jgi:hypothetical protein
MNGPRITWIKERAQITSVYDLAKNYLGTGTGLEILYLGRGMGL